MLKIKTLDNINLAIKKKQLFFYIKFYTLSDVYVNKTVVVQVLTLDNVWVQ